LPKAWHEPECSRAAWLQAARSRKKWRVTRPPPPCVPVAGIMDRTVNYGPTVDGHGEGVAGTRITTPDSGQ